MAKYTIVHFAGISLIAIMTTMTTLASEQLENNKQLGNGGGGSQH